MLGQKKPDTKSTDATRPLDATADCPRAWLGSSLHVNGEITGTEDMLIDGLVEGVIHLDERRLTVGTTARLTADIDARDVVVYGYVRFHRNRPQRGEGTRAERLRARGGCVGRGAEKHLTILHGGYRAFKRLPYPSGPRIDSRHLCSSGILYCGNIRLLHTAYIRSNQML